MGFEPDADQDFHSEAWEKAAYDYELDASNEWLQEEISEAFAGLSVESVRAYLGMYGDAVTERVEGAIGEA
jgi:hypothetical protein